VPGSQHRDIELAFLALSSIPVVAAPSTSWSTWSQGWSPPAISPKSPRSGCNCSLCRGL